MTDELRERLNRRANIRMAQLFALPHQLSEDESDVELPEVSADEIAELERETFADLRASIKDAAEQEAMLNLGASRKDLGDNIERTRGRF